MKFVIYLFLLSACSSWNPNALILKDSVTKEDLKTCSSNDESDNREILPSLKGQCNYIKEPSPHHHVTRQVINGEICCVVEIYIDHGDGVMTPVAARR